MFYEHNVIVCPQAREVISRGDIGDVKIAQCDFGFQADIDDAIRLFEPSVGGGALLDIGIYPIAAVFHAFNTTKPPTTVAACGQSERAVCMMLVPHESI